MWVKDGYGNKDDSGLSISNVSRRKGWKGESKSSESSCEYERNKSLIHSLSSKLTQIANTTKHFLSSGSELLWVVMSVGLSVCGKNRMPNSNYLCEEN